MAKQEETRKWNWKTDWCKERKLNPFTLENRELAEKAWIERAKADNRERGIKVSSRSAISTS
ncbi:MAG: hypothetical protein IBX55_00395 [Methyloprofundus sp.]|nr:hypothetical protein [Methyloprofundus sp.]